MYDIGKIKCATMEITPFISSLIVHRRADSPSSMKYFGPLPYEKQNNAEARTNLHYSYKKTNVYSPKRPLKIALVFS